MATDITANSSGKLPWAGKSVRPDEVEDALTTLWHLAADNMRISQNMNVRTSVLNLVICALSNDAARQASTLLRDLSSTHIARVILVILDTRSELPSSVSTWITLRSFPIISDVMRHPFEQITVRLTGNAAYSATQIIQPFFKPDLPIYLWWADDLPTDLSIFHKLIASSNRVIINSNDFSSPEEHIRNLNEMFLHAPNSAISDLNWGRITPWRELIAQFFDVAEYRPYLVNVNVIEIEHAIIPLSPGTSQTNGHATLNPIRALLLATWLYTRLGWQSDDDGLATHDTQTGTYHWRLTTRKPSAAISGSLIHTNSGQVAVSTENTLDIVIRPRIQAELQPGKICLVRLSNTNQDAPAIFTIDREQDADNVITSVQLPGSNLPQRTVNIAATHKEEIMLHDELEIMGRDHLYEQTLHEVFSQLKD